ncbi:ribosome silencing factor [Gephyromycinifex aptenodytis]|uniref:ribosome silencing factor n=1 Tax=Gephyromycinifex aptenodytis TaxID=2716227 RepID=UPI001444AC20|nr:ribosome silencing factor [Gephyromycinifex aptenodytis]
MPATPEALKSAQIAATAAHDKLATDIVAVDVSTHLALTDIFVIASAPSDRQVVAIVDNVEEQMRKAGMKPLRREGERGGHWVLLDFGDIVVHVMQDEDRVFYQLERLWKDCPAVPLELDQAPGENAAHESDSAQGGTDTPEENGASS